MRNGVLTVGMLWLALGSTGAAAGDDCVTLVADLAGTVTVADSATARPRDRWPVQLLHCFPARKVLTLEPQARITLFFSHGARSVDLSGPARYEITGDGVRALDGSPAPAERALNRAFRDLRLDRAALSPAGVRMRDPLGDRLVLLEPLGVITEPGPLTFRWQAASGGTGPYRLRLAREHTDVMYEAIVDDSQLTLPAEIALVPGERMLWHVEELSAARRAAARWQGFVLATEEAQALAREIGPKSGSPAERNLRDLLLMQHMTADR
jgi:hypothetical protein